MGLQSLRVVASQDGSHGPRSGFDYTQPFPRVDRSCSSGLGSDQPVCQVVLAADVSKPEVAALEEVG